MNDLIAPITDSKINYVHNLISCHIMYMSSRHGRCNIYIYVVYISTQYPSEVLIIFTCHWNLNGEVDSLFVIPYATPLCDRKYALFLTS